MAGLRHRLCDTRDVLMDRNALLALVAHAIFCILQLVNDSVGHRWHISGLGLLGEHRSHRSSRKNRDATFRDLDGFVGGAHSVLANRIMGAH